GYRDECALLAVELEELLEVELEYRVSVEADEGLGEEPLGGLELACVAEGAVRARVFYPHPKVASVAEVLLDHPPEVTGGYHDVLDVVGLQPVDDVLEDGLGPDREHRLGQEERVGPEPGAEPAA